MAFQFDHEKLRAYQEGLRFSAWVEPIIEKLPSRMSARDQLDRSSTSVVLNIAEGNGKRSKVDRCQYLDIARGSAVESAACLDVLVARKKLTAAEVEEGKTILLAAVSLISGLLARFAPPTPGNPLMQEEPALYGVENEND
jgi:four helix bundle protein